MIPACFVPLALANLNPLRLSVSSKPGEDTQIRTGAQAQALKRFSASAVKRQRQSLAVPRAKMRSVPTPSRSAVCLLSGGLDSSTCLALARRDGYSCYALSFDYGQRHSIELEAAARVAASIGVEQHLVAGIGLDAFGGSALTDDIAVPKARSAEEIGNGIPV